jgi:ribonuclease-3
VLQERVGHRFADLTLLYEALTHRSALMELSVDVPLDLPWNERLEFLGDAVVGLCISRRIMGPKGGELRLAEGELSRIRAALVNEESLALLARRLELGRYLVMGKGAALSGGRDRDSLLADALEALIGAVFMDGGFERADAVVGGLVDDMLAGDLRLLVQTDYKTMLQELTQDRLRLTPSYEVTTETGPDHDKIFEVKVLVAGKELGRGRGASKKRASQEAARHAIALLSGGGSFNEEGRP